VQIPLQFLYLNYAYLHIAAEEIAIYNRMVLIRALTNSVIAIGMLMFTDSGLWAVLLASVGSFVAGLLYGWAALDRRHFSKPKIDAPLMLALARYGWHLYAAGLLAQLSVYGVRTIIVFFLAPVQVAYYGLAQGAGLLMDRLPQALGTVMFPRISRSGRAESAKLAANAFRIATIFLAAGGIALAVLADALITLLYGEAYSPVARALRIMLPGIVIAGAASTLVNYFQGCGRADLVPKIQLAPLLVQLIAALVLTHRWGLDGAALALSLGLSSTGSLQILVFLRITDTRARDLMPRGIDVRQIRDLLGRSVVMRSFARKGQSRPANREPS
jgi:O-antigen/teichoic acid export membrane protein